MRVVLKTYRWHDGFSILADNVAKWHLGTLVGVCPDLWMVDIRDLLNWDCVSSAVGLAYVEKTYFGPGHKSW